MLHPTASDCEFAVWNFTVGYCMNAADALSLLPTQAAENANGVPSVFAWHRADSMALRLKRIFAI